MRTLKMVGVMMEVVKISQIGYKVFVEENAWKQLYCVGMQDDWLGTLPKMVLADFMRLSCLSKSKENNFENDDHEN